MAPSSRVRGLLVLLVVLGAGVVGCADGAERAASRYEDELAALPGVAGASVERTAFDTEYFGEEIVVDLAPDATAAEAAAVLDSFDERLAEQGEPQEARLTVGAGTTDTVGDDFAPDAPPQATSAGSPGANARLAGTFLAAVRAFPDAHVTITGDGWMVIAAAAAAEQTAVLDEMIAAVRAEKALARSGAFDLRVTDGDVDDPRSLALIADDGLSAGLLDAWRTIRPGLGAPALRSLMLGTGAVHLDLRVADQVLPRELTVAAHGDALWPVLRPALDALRALPAPATLTAIHRYTDPEFGEGYLEDRFLVVHPDLRTGRDRHGRTWNAEASDYLAASSG